MIKQAGSHESQRVSGGKRPVDDPDQANHAPVGVEEGIENQCSQRGTAITRRSRQATDDSLQELIDPLPRLGGDAEGIIGVATDHRADLGRHSLRLRGRQVDLVDYRNDLQTGFHCHIGIGEGLGFYPLGGIDHQQGALYRVERA